MSSASAIETLFSRRHQVSKSRQRIKLGTLYLVSQISDTQPLINTRTDTIYSIHLNTAYIMTGLQCWTATTEIIRPSLSRACQRCPSSKQAIRDRDAQHVCTSF